MKMFFLGSIAALSLTMASCGGGQHHPEAAAGGHHCENCEKAGHKHGADGGEAHDHGEHAKHGKHGGEHGIPAGALHDFHEVLAPIWHGDKGAPRAAKTCEQLASLKTQAAAVSAGAAAAVKADAETLVREIDALTTDCADPARAGVEARLHTVHETFHKVLEGSGVKH